MSLYSSILRPILFRLPAEPVHELALESLSLALRPDRARKFVEYRLHRSPFGELKRCGLSFSNPIGLAAGFDKNGAAASALAALGFGFVEVGTVTHEPQPGNPRPRIFRLPDDQALINRAGFNNCGAEALAKRLRRRRPDCVLGVNIGKSRSVPVTEAAADYLATFREVYDVADYLAINVSSPNTPQLRELQRPELLSELLDVLQQRNRAMAEQRLLAQPKPLFVKIAPDLTERDIQLIVEVALRAKIDGMIATNTTVRRDELQTATAQVEACGDGGLSGAPLRARSNEVIALLHCLTQGAVTIVGVGGIFTAEDAWEKICAGASLLQLYTGFIYQGPGVARQINEGLAEICRREGFHSLDDAVGCRANQMAARGGTQFQAWL